MARLRGIRGAPAGDRRRPSGDLDWKYLEPWRRCGRGDGDAVGHACELQPHAVRPAVVQPAAAAAERIVPELWHVRDVHARNRRADLSPLSRNQLQVV